MPNCHCINNDSGKVDWSFDQNNVHKVKQRQCVLLLIKKEGLPQGENVHPILLLAVHAAALAHKSWRQRPPNSCGDERCWKRQIKDTWNVIHIFNQAPWGRYFDMSIVWMQMPRCRGHRGISNHTVDSMICTVFIGDYLICKSVAWEHSFTTGSGSFMNSECWNRKFTTLKLMKISIQNP